MNRLKVWVYALVVIGLAGFGLYLFDGALRARGLEAVDRQLRAAKAHAEAAERASTGELATLAAIAAGDEKLGAALHAGAAPAPAAPAAGKQPAKKLPPAPPPPSPEQAETAVDQAGAEAVTAALAITGAKPANRVVRAVSREGFDRAPPPEPDVAAFLKEALGGKVVRGYAVLNQKLHLGAAAPAGDRGALAIFVPVDAAWVKQQVVSSTGEASESKRRATVALVLSAPQVPPLSNAPADAQRLSAMAARTASSDAVASSVEKLGPVDVAPAWSPVKLPALGPLLGGMPADRVSSRELPGVKGGSMVVAAATAPALAPVVQFEWYALAGLALALLLTIPFSLLVKPTEVIAALPPVLLDAARKIEKGDFSVRAPVLAGKLGTLAAALNKAVDAAQSGPPSTPPIGSLTSEFYARAPEPASDGADPFAMPVRGPRAAPVAAPATEAPAAAADPEPKAVDDTARLDGANLSGSAFQAAPVPAAKPAPVAAPVPAAPAAVAPAPRAVVAPAVSAPPPTAEFSNTAARPAPIGDGDEEQHWREVFRDFVRTRAECGESAEGLTYERFRQKLESNKGALVAKYGCKTVRFQVYVKDGKAALKATPVR